MANSSHVQDRTKDKQDEAADLLIDTSKMSDAKRKALEVAESARDEYTQQSFARDLFLGKFNFEMLLPFPKQSPEEKAIGDDLCERVGRYLQEHLDADEVDRSCIIPDHNMKGLAELGLFGMKVPKEYGGLGLSQVNYNRVLMVVGSHCGSTAAMLSAHQSIGVPEPLKLFGTDQQKKKYFPKIAAGAVTGFALTEPEVGSDPAQMSTTAELSDDGSHYILNGDKLWCTNGLIADAIVVMAKTKPKMVNGREVPQVTAMIVDGDSEGIERVHRCDFMGLRGIQNGVIRFNNVKVPVENLLWKEGRGLALALRTLLTGRLAMPSGAAAAGKASLAVGRRWGKKREQWGSPIAEHEAGAEKLSYIASMTMAMEAITWLTSHWADKKEFDIRVEGAMAKLFTSEAQWKVVDECLQMRGGRGYETGPSLGERGEDAWPVERMLRDSRIARIVEGTSEVMYLILAREALDPHLTKAKVLLSKKSGLGEKLGAAVKLAGFYLTWYPRQWLNGSLFRRHSDKGELAPWFRFVDRNAHRMARVLFHKMLRYGPGLESRQIVLSQLSSIASELFAMAATCAYAQHLSDERRGDRSPFAVADHFCTFAKTRIENHFRRLKSKDEQVSNKLTKRILNEEMTWLEEGILIKD